MKRTRTARQTTPSPGRLAVYLNARFIPKGQVPSRRKRDQHQTIPARQALANKLAYDSRRQPGMNQPRAWVDCGLGATTAAIIDACEQMSAPGDTLARSLVVSLDPALEALLPTDQRHTVLATIIEQTIQNGYQDFFELTDRVPYAYVLHDQPDRYGRARTHAHITLPGGFTDAYTGQFQDIGQLPKDILLKWNALANEVGLSELDHTLRPEWRLEIPFYRDSYVPQPVHSAHLDTDNLDVWFPRIAVPSPTASARNMLVELDAVVQDREQFNPAAEAVPKSADRISEASIDPPGALSNEPTLSQAHAERVPINRSLIVGASVEDAATADEADFEAIGEAMFGAADRQSIARFVMGLRNNPDRLSALAKSSEHSTTPQQLARLAADWKVPKTLNNAPVLWTAHPDREDLLFGFFGTWNDPLALGSLYLTVAWGEPTQPSRAPLPQLIYRVQPTDDPGFLAGDSPHLARTRRVMHDVFDAKMTDYKKLFSEGKGVAMACLDFQKTQAPDPLVYLSFLPHLPDAYRQPEWANTLPTAQLLPQAAWVFDPHKKSENVGVMLTFFDAQYHLAGIAINPAQADPVEQTGMYSQLDTFEQAAGLLWAARHAMRHDFLTKGVDSRTRWGAEFDNTVSAIAQRTIHQWGWLADAERDLASQPEPRHPTLAEPERRVNDQEPGFDFDR